MSFRNWVYVFAITGLTLSLSGQAWSQSAIEGEPRQEESTADVQQDSQEKQKLTGDLIPALNDIESAIRDLIAEEDKIASEAQRSREKRGLYAQEAMAEWAKWMFFATLATVLLTFVALVYIRRTLLETKDAVRAADETVVATREIGQAQVRAYLSFEIDEAEFRAPALAPDDISDPLPNITASLHGSITNSGQSPASEVSIIFDIGVIIPGEAIEIGDAKDFHHQRPIAFSIQANGRFPRQTVSRTFTTDLEALRAEGKLVFFAIILQWKDVFGKTIKSDPTFGTIEFMAQNDGGRRIFYGGIQEHKDSND
jgi:hypothetical protein